MLDESLAEIITPIAHFEEARKANTPDLRLELMRKAATEFRQSLLAGPRVRYYRSMELVRVPYPTSYAFLNCKVLPQPFIHILNRLFVVQVDTPVGVKTLLLSPSDVSANAETPYFKQMVSRFGRFEETVKGFLSPQLNTVETCLQQLGIAPESIDFISFDHLHTQDIRRWLGTGTEAGVFPNAKLLVMEKEWNTAEHLLAPQYDWYCPQGIEGVAADKIIRLNSDVMIGAGFALVQTPGHTLGNHSFVANTEQGVRVTSENGVGPDCYAPLHSRIPGLKKYAQRTGMEVILNGNSLEHGLDQYISMVVEKTLAGPHPEFSDFPNMANSSELTGYWGFPGYKPTVTFGNALSGTLTLNSSLVA